VKFLGTFEEWLKEVEEIMERHPERRVPKNEEEQDELGDEPLQHERDLP
jgi:hypothetical protein